MLGGGQFQSVPAIVNQLKRNVRMRDCQPNHGVADMPEFRRAPFEEFPPSRRIKKKIPNLRDGTQIACGRLGLIDLSAVIIDFVCHRVIGRPAQQPSLRTPRRYSPRFTPKAHGGDAEQIIIALQFIRGVGSESQRQLSPGFRSRRR